MANQPDRPREQISALGSFEELCAVVNRKFGEAVSANYDSPRHLYVMPAMRERAKHPLAVFALGSSMDDVLHQRAELFELEVPVRRPDVRLPVSVLAAENGADYFYVTHRLRARQDGAVRLDPTTYHERSKRKDALVINLTHKIFTYTVLPLRDKEYGFDA